MNKRQREQYFEYDGLKCPYCTSKDIHTGEAEVKGKVVYQNNTCGKCNRLWTDVFTLTDVEDCY